ncbi:hypothetical protein LguiB_026149 [Lonicera macranthoides]
MFRVRFTALAWSFGNVKAISHVQSRMTGQLSPKSGVYDFGVILLELLTGREPVDHVEYGQKSLVAWATPKIRKDKLKRYIDPRLKGDFHPGQAAKLDRFGERASETLIPSVAVHFMTLQDHMNNIGWRHRPSNTVMDCNNIFITWEINQLMQQQNDKQAINIQPIAIPCVQLDELKEITYNFGTNA